MRDQIVTLEYKTNRMITVRIPISVLIFFCGNAIDDKISAVIAVQYSDNIKKRGFTGTTAPSDCYEFIISQIQTHIVQSLLYQTSSPVLFFDVLYLKHSNSPIVIF